MLQQRWTSKLRYTRCSVCSFSHPGKHGVGFLLPFPTLPSFKNGGFDFRDETLSWLIQWRYWTANRWHAVWQQHILVPVWIAWNPAKTNFSKTGSLRFTASQNHAWKLPPQFPWYFLYFSCVLTATAPLKHSWIKKLKWGVGFLCPNWHFTSSIGI